MRLNYSINLTLQQTMQKKDDKEKTTSLVNVRDNEMTSFIPNDKCSRLLVYSSICLVRHVDCIIFIASYQLLYDKVETY